MEGSSIKAVAKANSSVLGGVGTCLLRSSTPHGQQVVLGIRKVDSRELGNKFVHSTTWVIFDLSPSGKGYGNLCIYFNSLSLVERTQMFV